MSKSLNHADFNTMRKQDNLRERVASKCICCDSNELMSSPAILMPFVAHRALGYAPVLIDESWGLRTINSGTAYTIAKSLLCKTCFCVFLDIRFSDLEMSRLYENYRGTEYTKLRENYEPGYSERNARLSAGIKYLPVVESFLRRYVPKHPKILDWGGDTGQNSPFKNERQILDIFDISNKNVIPKARRVDSSMIARQRYDLVICSNVLEHIPFPADLLVEIRKSMQNETILYIEVPHEELMRNPDTRDISHLLKKHWHEHINFFTLQSLEALISLAGMQVLEIKEAKVPTETSTDFILMAACRLQDL
jgi:hypothetical protein